MINKLRNYTHHREKHKHSPPHNPTKLDAYIEDKDND